ncbi:HlyD family efflux transporter periplasmic adaptor subunit [Methylobacillus flagellatus]|uniref:HlyD family secretion protein n=1 Tax=Methylobacillus TaxID=404 RepID=UPI002853EBA5|nr:HlyD family efflux transporter periplasmic adaptor subunit [Methylobacillus flagellatus]MDR5172395.1 HlyD family efflux transporter periplasmic adaptor subunit [Methylobacillus flagellatus]
MMPDIIDNQQFSQYTVTPRLVKRILFWVVVSCFIVPALILFLPWQQNVQAMGAVTAFAPLERRQSVDAPVGGVIRQWFVREGSRVNAGDPLLEISDVDPRFKERLAAQRQTVAAKLKAKQDELQAYEVQLQNLLAVRQARIAAVDYGLNVAQQKVVAAAESVASAQAMLDAADFQVGRMQRLVQEGLVSRRDVELAERDRAVALRNVNSAKAALDSARAEEKAAVASQAQVRAETQANIDTSRALISKISSEVADTQNELTSLEISLARQESQLVRAPRAGTVFRLPVNSQSQVINQGQPLLVIIPDTEQRAVELMVKGLDAALILPGSRVRLEFDGWPALQISGWPNVAIGTFGGKVAFVDASDDGTGRFRVMVVPDESVQKWPSERFLRQGSSARGWILLEEVSIGYEVWRVLNGFPPRVPQPAANAFQGA